MAAPSVTYTFTNGTTADATQVNTNFNDLILGASDGTKDYTINNLTVNGNLTVSGSTITLGSASGDSIVFTGSVGSSIPVAANDTYDFGSSSLAMRSFYIGSNTRSIRLIAGTLTGSYTLTLPVAAPTKTGMILTFDTNATATFRFANKLTASKTTNYTATSDETVIPCDASGGAFTVTLPAASGNSGMVLTIIKTDSSLANAVTIDGNGSETINGSTTTTLNTQYEALKIICDGSNWLILERRYPSGWTDYSLTIGAVTTAPTKGTTSLDTASWMRQGDSIILRYNYRQTAAGSAGSGVYLFPAPTGVTFDTTPYISGNSTNTSQVGNCMIANITGGTLYSGVLILHSSTQLAMQVSNEGTAHARLASGFLDVSTTAVLYTYHSDPIKVSGWNS